MPTPTKHANKASSNRRFLDAIDLSTAADWAAVVAFYTAVHLVEQIMALDGHHSQNHQDRLDYVLANHPAVRGPYRQLYDTSRLARYMANDTFHGHFPPERVRDEVIGTWLQAVEEYVTAYVQSRPKPS